jgi:UDP-N-acetylglucosamine 3-dehydrogenase
VTNQNLSGCSMDGRKTHIGVIGVGYWGRKIVDECCRIEGLNLVGVADRDPAKLQFCAEHYRIPGGYRDYRPLLDRDDLDAVSVCAPNSLHYPIVRDALNAGKHVLVEKPMTLSSREGGELLALARASGLTLCVGHIFRFNNALAEIRRLIYNQEFFGKIYLLDMNWLSLEREFPDRDVIWDQGPHIFDIQNYILNEWPAELSCAGGAFRRSTGEESAHIICRFSQGTLATASISWLVPRKRREIFITGELRSALVDVLTQKITLFEGASSRDLPVIANNTIRDELLHFTRMARLPGGDTNGASMAVRTLELIEAAKRSVAERRTVTLG